MARRFRAKYTEEELVEILALAGSSNEAIAEVLGVCKSTVKNNYQELLTECREVAFGKVAGEIYHIAMLPIRDEAGEKLAPELVKAKTALLTFLAKTRLQWRETNRIEHTGADGEPLTKFVDAPPQETREQWEARMNKGMTLLENSARSVDPTGRATS